jgi:hypothetical protein
MIPLLFADGCRIKDKETADDQVEAAYERWRKAAQVAQKARAEASMHGQITVEDVCRVYLYAEKSGLIPENRISKYPVPRARSRATYITPEQEATLVEAANEAMAMAMKVCIRTGARYFYEYGRSPKCAKLSYRDPSGVSVLERLGLLALVGCGVVGRVRPCRWASLEVW